MPDIVFNAQINIYFPLNSSDSDIKKMEESAKNVMNHFIIPLSVQCNSVLFFYHPDEQSEQCGHHDFGVKFDLTRKVKNMQSYYNYVKFFDGLSGLLKNDKSFHKTEFLLL